jgi:hypothetical protein
VDGAGVILGETIGVVPFDASPIVKLARSRSSRFDLSLDPWSGVLELFGDENGTGLPERREASDFRRFNKADSASSVEERGCDERGLWESNERELEAALRGSLV